MIIVIRRGPTRVRGHRGHRRPALAVSLLAASLVLLLGGCTSWFFVPDRALRSTPADFGLAFTDVAIETADGVTLHAWLIEPDGAPVGSVYFLHGNAQNVSTHVRSTIWLVEAGYRVLALDYRGYGRSGGTPDIPEVFEDIRAGAEWLFGHLDEQGDGRGDAGPVHVFAQSLGASLAIRHLELEPAQRARIDSLIVEAAFTGYGAVARHVARQSWLLRPLGPVAESLLAGPHDPLDAIGSLAPLPILVIHSPDDEIVPYEFGLELYAEAGAPKAFATASGRHIGGVQSLAVRRTMLGFMRRHGRD